MLHSIYSKLTPYSGRKHIVVNDQSVGDIISNLLKTHVTYRNEYDKIASNFEKNGTESTAKGIYNFIKQNIPYKVESDDRQLLKSPSAILYTANSIGSDCKNYSLFTGGILDALNRKGRKIDWCYRFASYKLSDKLPHHVFVVINPGTNNEIWVDAVLPTFNMKKSYYYKVDKKPMALISMAGVEYEGIGKTAKKTQRQAARAQKKTARKAAQPAKKTARKEAIKKKAQKIKGAIKKAGRVVLKFNPATATARNAFLGIVNLNFRSIATNLKLAIQKDRARVEKFWTSVGGKFESLVKAAENGSKRKRLGGIGVAPAAAPAAVAVATPLIIKIIDIFKKLGIKSEDLGNVAKSVVEKIASEKVDQINEMSETGEYTPGSSDGSSYSSSSDGSSYSSSSDGSSSEEYGSDPTGSSIMNNKTLLIGGAALAAFLLFRKK